MYARQNAEKRKSAMNNFYKGVFKMKKVLALAFSALFIFTGCGKDVSTDEKTSKSDTSVSDDTSSESNTAISEETSTGGEFVITLYPEYAPITCENFETLVSDGFYDGLIFHRVVEGFMAQGGDPQGTGMGGSKETIKGEFSSNGVNNTLSHKRGIVSMARSQNPDSASSQFFICYDDSCSFLDGNYAAFGEVTEGMEVVDDFLKVPRSLGSDNAISSPNSPIRIKEAVMIEDDENGNPRVQVTMNEFLED